MALVLMPMVLGVCVHGDKVVNCYVPLDGKFKPVPVPYLVGVPLRFKCLPTRCDQGIKNNVIVPWMSHPDHRLAPAEWQYGGSRGAAPPVLLAREDRVPFSDHDWALLDKYIAQWLEQPGADLRQATLRVLQASAFFNYVRRTVNQHVAENAIAFLSIQYPVGSIVKLEGLSATELNGVEGTVVQYSRNRVGVEVPGRTGPVALQPERLVMVREALLMNAGSSLAHEHNPVSQEQRHARAGELLVQDCRQVAKRFIECIMEDTFPEEGDLMWFGVGKENRQQCTVLGAWQHLVKNGKVTEDILAASLEQGTTQELFERQCRDVAEQRCDMSNYAKTLVETKFRSVEWEKC